MKQQLVNGYKRKRSTFIYIVLFVLFTLIVSTQTRTYLAVAEQAQIAGVLSAGSEQLYVSSSTGGDVGVAFADEDILYWSASNGWSIFFDGSDVGLSGSSARDVDAFHILTDGTILLSLAGDTTLPDIGNVDDSDILRFVPTSLGNSTAGTFEWYLDGSDVGLTTYSEDIDAMTDLGEILANGALCALGRSAANPVLSTLKYFKDEYLAHIVDKKCPAGVCRELIEFKIDADKCTGCGACARACSTQAITGEKKEPHTINQGLCIKCGACYDACKFDAVIKG